MTAQDLICGRIAQTIDRIRKETWANERGRRAVFTGMELALIIAEGDVDD